MPQSIEAIWINANSSFKRFDGRVVRYLSQQKPVAFWEYQQNQDEPSSLDVALILLHDYINSLPQPIHLIGHGTGGLLALMYARKYPHKVKSLTLLGVGFHPAIDWQAHYYAMRKLLPCSQEIILSRMVEKLFGYQNRYNTVGLSEILKQDLATSPAPHSLYQEARIAPMEVPMPLMVCGSENDEIVNTNSLYDWQNCFKKSDVLWECPQGHHFFHYFFPNEVGKRIIEFWKSISAKKVFSDSLAAEQTSLA
jgi:pimeloyl-ACP methyl ester carboxylesterase